MTVNTHEAKTQFSKLLRRVESGEEIIIARGGRPVAKLVPIVSAAKREFGHYRGQIEIADDFNSPLPETILSSFE